MGKSVATAIRAARQDKPFDMKGAILPKKPPIDKVAAFAALSMGSTATDWWIDFHDRNEFDDKQIAAWEARGVCSIDLGDRKYHKVDEGSATEWVITNYALPLSPGLKELVALINKNNQTGFLKSFQFSVPFLLREMYELQPEDKNWWTVVVKNVADVITSFVKVLDGHIVRPLDTPIDEEVEKLVKKFSASAHLPLTLGQYVSNLWLLGQSSEEIQQKLNFWQSWMKRLKKACACAEKQVQEMPDNSFNVETVRGTVKGIVLCTSNYFVSKIVVRRAKQYAIRITVNHDGHVGISTNKLDVKALHWYLNRREPGRWHLNEQMGALINGGLQYTGVRPTDIPSEKLVEMVQYYLAPKNNKSK